MTSMEVTLTELLCYLDLKVGSSDQHLRIFDITVIAAQVNAGRCSVDY